MTGMPDGTVAVVTGGASGLGAATARLVCARGGRAAIIDRDAERGERLARELGKSARCWPADVTDVAELEDVIAAARAAFGGVHILDGGLRMPPR
jgi:NAD(P)-dependent dehydrogenase (short-subunit alcohol dehydrogenase family)